MPNLNRFLALLMLVAFGASLGSFVRAPKAADRANASAPELLPTAYANPVNLMFEDTLYSGETLSELLARAELAEAEAQALLNEVAQHQDPRRMKPGMVIALQRDFEDGALRAMELRIDPDRTLAMRRAGEVWEGVVEEVEVRKETVVLTGSIETSLYEALADGAGGDVPARERTVLADILADQIFAWQLDFSRDLQPGDQFRILYERLVRPDGSARSGRVLGAQLSIHGRDFEAYAHSSASGDGQHYDRDGASLRRAFLRAPLEYRRISSAFSRSRFHPILRVRRPHNGIDYAAAAGTPIRAVGDGVVRSAGKSGGYGNLIEIRHGRGYATRYAHLQRFASGIRSGVRVKQGDVIGYVGSTGQSTAPHLHFEFHVNGKPINPNGVPDVTGDPVPDSQRAEFDRVVREHIAAMDKASPRVLLADRGTTASSRTGE